MSKPKIRVAIIGTGNIGTDLCARMLLDDSFDVRALAGRRNDSPGLAMFKGKVPHLISNGIEGLRNIIDEIDGVFDATSAFDHKAHWLELGSRGKWMIDLTPSQIGSPLVPELLGKNLDMQISLDVVANYSMVTCGGQSSAPLVHAIAAHSLGISEVEVSSSIAALSAGPATRRNIDQYVQSTENLVQLISGCEKARPAFSLESALPPTFTA